MLEKNSLSNFERRHQCKFSLVSPVERNKLTVQGRCCRPPPAPVDEPVHRDELAFGRVGRPGGDSPRHRRRPGGRVTPPSTPHRKFRSTSRILTLAASASTTSRSLDARAGHSTPRRSFSRRRSFPSVPSSTEQDYAYSRRFPVENLVASVEGQDASITPPTPTQ